MAAAMAGALSAALRALPAALRAHARPLERFAASTLMAARAPAGLRLAASQLLALVPRAAGRPYKMLPRVLMGVYHPQRLRLRLAALQDWRWCRALLVGAGGLRVPVSEKGCACAWPSELLALVRALVRVLLGGPIR